MALPLALKIQQVRSPAQSLCIFVKMGLIERCIFVIFGLF